MNRRGFFARSAAVLAGIMASCQFMPELASAEERKFKVETLHSLSPDTYEKWNVGLTDLTNESPFGRSGNEVSPGDHVAFLDAHSRVSNALFDYDRAREIAAAIHKQYWDRKCAEASVRFSR